MRGYKDCSYHADILWKFKEEELESMEEDVQVDCQGGGRIRHTNKRHLKEIFIIRNKDL